MLYPDNAGQDQEISASGDDTMNTSIENDINAELAELNKPRSVQLFSNVRIDVQCGLYMRFS